MMMKITIPSIRQRVLSFFDTHTQLDYRVLEISKTIGIDHRIVRHKINDLIEEGKVIKIRNMGPLSTYQIPEWLTDVRKQELELL